MKNKFNAILNYPDGSKEATYYGIEPKMEDVFYLYGKFYYIAEISIINIDEEHILNILLYSVSKNFISKDFPNKITNQKVNTIIKYPDGKFDYIYLGKIPKQREKIYIKGFFYIFKNIFFTTISNREICYVDLQHTLVRSKSSYDVDYLNNIKKTLNMAKRKSKINSIL